MNNKKKDADRDRQGKKMECYKVCEEDDRQEGRQKV